MGDIAKEWLYSYGLALAYCFHQLTGQRFSGEHLDSFLVGNKKIREEEISIL
jgi:hypothetical protein